MTKQSNTSHPSNTMEIVGTVYNRIETMGDKDFQHLGFDPDEGDFGDMLEQLVPHVGDKLRVKVVFSILEKQEK
ncbi:MAG: hypothetical protein GXP45_05570 [bacterium]|nr:hypothetical protein [bacterium]